MAGDHSARDDPSKKKPSTPLSTKKSHKRKRDPDGLAVATSTPTPTKKAKKSESSSSTSTPLKEERKKKRRSETAASDSVQEESSQKVGTISPVSSKTGSSRKDNSKDKTKSKPKKAKRENSGGDLDSPEYAADIEETNGDSDRKTKRHEDPQATEAASEEENNSKLAKNKYSGILSKFEKAIRATGSAKTKPGEEDVTTELPTAEPVRAQGLEPLPQPEAAPEQDEKPSYSSLPPWLANPLKTSAEERTPFSSLGIEENVLRILEDNGYKDAFAVQSTVIPLLLQGPKNHPGDLCISAATGSGKTLSYVLPLVTALEQIPAPRLRGLIVVPTRELVKQAREACELCAAGSGLRVASAVGNVAIKDEQRSLMRTDQAYGPEKFKLRQQDKLTDNDWMNFSLQGHISDAGDQSESLPGYIRKAEPNVDILICTPGRLVDHIRYTKGFTLKHLEWLVIDEADRLLNESFQEWVDVVIKSLEARKDAETFGFSGELLANLGLPIQTKDPRKVILSATMTRDISKLNSLRLSNPKLVIVGSGEQAATHGDESGIPLDRSDDQFALPPRLKEYSVSVGDGSQKPLYLLRLLREHIKVEANANTKSALAVTSESEGSSSEDSSSEESSSEDSDSSDSDSDTSSSDETSSEDSDSDSGSSDDSSSSSGSSDNDDTFESEDEFSADVKSKDSRPRSTVLIFTKSSESASRLSRLLALLDPSLANQIGTIIKSNKSSASRKTLTAYRQGKTSIIIATDRASRGLDLQGLTHVVNYDVPPSITTYVHRVGRTARAGREGSAWTLFAHREGRWFVKEIAQRSDSMITRSFKVHRAAIKVNDMKDIKSRYKQALDVLEKEVQTGGTAKNPKAEK
ncbi:P-loop containing nucleoside triphosphate hydrolase protein [Aspergillus leporis]|jgi:ATP-dependent RNA helicase DDX51/DBP6|uniref:ATP-dependent RNA helicase n=1 Tax=Aspergillus leporis TaxID=41062 RepID=A0A5N5X0C1_9EURO|nr:P-loop containing nucleoside triphosphate hydrolase protein [Aspergillus leporis]